MKILLSCLLFLDLFVILSCVSISVGLGTLHPSQLPTDFITLVNVAILLGTSCILLILSIHTLIVLRYLWSHFGAMQQSLLLQFADE